MGCPKETELALWLALTFAPRIGPAFIKNWLNCYSINDLMGADAGRLLQIGFNQQQASAIIKPDMRRIEHCLAWQNEYQTIITTTDARYPPQLKQLTSAPPLLFVRGRCALLSEPQIAIVGSRNSSVSGRENAFYFARKLSEQGYGITSGLALGIDGQAHRGALQNSAIQGTGKTVAVLGAGLNHIYPKRHQPLADEIVETGGAVISEFIPSTPVNAVNFPRRNRVISGLSLGVLIVESAVTSGSLITARYALEQNREVFAIPGSIHNPLSKGCHALIKEGAKLVEDIEDIFVEIAPIIASSSSKQRAIKMVNSDLLSPLCPVLDNVSDEMTPVDIIATRSNMSVSDVMMRLLELELEGWVLAVPGGYVKTRSGN
ncbi:DNA-processing protein DprA [Vibrio sp. SS-MA-C1-2]|uniref:DNA-processing protein DprA n=1 Tax=Vibrio sp. SS-MA-C1-2 TaxID=2908646 RepID=UPI001F1E9751|nr:DNA-processing protein DprA [Vibrio sp. SS-MA-C1-2]UJF19359.1 DNA-processing protein DprA [Vibrio sp. SS-MA-C1-2]